MLRKHLLRHGPLLGACLFLALLLLCAQGAVAGAKQGLDTCLGLIIPSLFPFFVVSGLLSALGLPQVLRRFLSPAMSRLFGVSGAGATAFLLGITGGYPLGAKTVADLYAAGSVEKEEAESLLSFCNNSGPAFILGAAGAGVFGRGDVGLLLYGVHILAAIGAGLLLARHKKGGSIQQHPPEFHTLRFTQAFAQSVQRAVSATVNICAYVVLFTVLTALLEDLGAFTALSGFLSSRLGLELTFSRSLLTGFLELGSGIASMSGLSPTPINLALCAGILSWGGLSVHCQTLAVLGDTGLSTRRHFLGRLVSAALAAALAFLLSSLFITP